MRQQQKCLNVETYFPPLVKNLAVAPPVMPSFLLKFGNLGLKAIFLSSTPCLPELY